MFSDAGYGLIMAAACAFCLWKYKNMDENWKNSLRMFLFCGLSTIFWGIIFSSYFGDVVDVVSRTFFGKQVSIPPVWFAPIQQPMLMLIFCLAIGVIHLTVGYGIKGLSHIKQGRWPDAIFDALFPLGLIYPLLVMLTGSEMFYGMAGFKIDLSAATNDGLLYASLFCMAGILLTGGRENKNFAIRLVTGLYALYNLLAGWISDILSYSRLLGLGLAAGVIASVMNQLGSMGGKSPVGILLFIVVFLVGQSLNFAINALGAYVHSNRLEYVEFFGKFYEGGGRKFSPFALNTKHIKPFLEK
jgi:V/A-type H+-transporting ATPase subunit I